MIKFCSVFLAIAAFASAADVSGKWQVTVKTKQGTGSPTITLEQKGDQVTGAFWSLLLGESKLAGTVKGDQIEFAFDASVIGQKLKVTYKGVVESQTAMKGTAVYAGYDDHATWTAVKK